MAMRKTGKSAGTKTAAKKTGRATSAATVKSGKSKTAGASAAQSAGRRLAAGMSNGTAVRGEARIAETGKTRAAPLKATDKKAASKAVGGTAAPLTPVSRKQPPASLSSVTPRQPGHRTAVAETRPQINTQQGTKKADARKRDASSPEARKKLAGQHLWELVEQKKRLAAQTPAWQQIEHHDHPAAGATDALPLPKA